MVMRYIADREKADRLHQQVLREDLLPSGWLELIIGATDAQAGQQLDACPALSIKQESQRRKTLDHTVGLGQQTGVQNSIRDANIQEWRKRRERMIEVVEPIHP